jgi:outer membrane protein
MFKRIFVITALLLSSNILAAELKIGLVDLGFVLAKAPQYEAAKEKINKQFKDRIEEVNKLGEQMKKIEETIKRDAMTLTEEQKISYQRQWNEIGADYKLKAKAIQEDIQRAENEERNKILARIKQAIDKVAKDEKFDLILRREAAVFAGQGVDISDKVLSIVSNPAG